MIYSFFTISRQEPIYGSFINIVCNIQMKSFEMSHNRLYGGCSSCCGISIQAKHQKWLGQLATKM